MSCPTPSPPSTAPAPASYPPLPPTPPSPPPSPSRPRSPPPTPATTPSKPPPSPTAAVPSTLPPPPPLVPSLYPTLLVPGDSAGWCPCREHESASKRLLGQRPRGPGKRGGGEYGPRLRQVGKDRPASPVRLDAPQFPPRRTRHQQCAHLHSPSIGGMMCAIGCRCASADAGQVPDGVHGPPAAGAREGVLVK